MNRSKTNLRLSYIGGGYDFPRFFEDKEVHIISEGLPLSIECVAGNVRLSQNSSQLLSVKWNFPLTNLGSGLGSSAARYLSFIRAKFPEASQREQINAAITLDGLQAGGWQDTIASAYDGLIKIVLHKNDWNVYPLEGVELYLHPYRNLYRIPVIASQKSILTSMRCRESSFDKIQALVKDGEHALRNNDPKRFGEIVLAAWNEKKQWHADISNPTIEGMEQVASDAGAWGWKVCGAGGQGYFLIIGDEGCHQHMQKHYELFKVDDENSKRLL